jgi:hypothetical protein
MRYWPKRLFAPRFTAPVLSDQASGWQGKRGVSVPVRLPAIALPDKSGVSVADVGVWLRAAG